MLWDICKSFAILYFRLLFLSHSLITKLGIISTSQLTIRLPRYDPKGQTSTRSLQENSKKNVQKNSEKNSLQTTVYRKMTHSKRIRWESFYNAISQRGTTIQTLTWRTQIVYNATDNRQGAVSMIKSSDFQASYIGETGRNLTEDWRNESKQREKVMPTITSLNINDLRTTLLTGIFW